MLAKPGLTRRATAAHLFLGSPLEDLRLARHAQPESALSENCQSRARGRTLFCTVQVVTSNDTRRPRRSLPARAVILAWSPAPTADDCRSHKPQYMGHSHAATRGRHRRFLLTPPISHPIFGAQPPPVGYWVKNGADSGFYLNSWLLRCHACAARWSRSGPHQRANHSGPERLRWAVGSANA